MHQENLFNTVLQAVQKDDLGEGFTRPDCFDSPLPRCRREAILKDSVEVHEKIMQRG
jgi:hypothetical protein